MYMKRPEWGKGPLWTRFIAQNSIRLGFTRTPPTEELHATNMLHERYNCLVRASWTCPCPPFPTCNHTPGLMSLPIINTKSVAPVTPHRPRPVAFSKAAGPVLQPRKMPATKCAAEGAEGGGGNSAFCVLGTCGASRLGFLS